MDDVFSAAKVWNETCASSDECFDDRMTCAPDDYNILRCLCNRFHKWSEQSRGCVQIYSVAYMMNQTVIVQDNETKLKKYEEAKFKGPVISIYFMIFVMVFSVLSIIIYCGYIRIKQSQSRKRVNNIFKNKEEGVFQRFSTAFPTTSQC